MLTLQYLFGMSIYVAFRILLFRIF